MNNQPPPTKTNDMSSVSTRLPSDPPADPNASANARAVLAFLQQLPQQKTQRLVSGQFVGWSYREHAGRLEAVVAKTGHFPALIGVDYFELPNSAHHSAAVVKKAMTASDFQPEAWGPFLTDYWNKGGLVTISLCMNNPWTGNNLYDVKGGGQLAELLDDSTPAHVAYMAQLKTIGDALAALAKAGVVVLLRPFPEMTHQSFWWGEKGLGHTEDFQKLWKHFFNYMTKDRDLHNLLWVFAPVPMGDIAAFYPGDDFVDIAGFSCYRHAGNLETALPSYNRLATVPKPLAFTENGPGNPLPLSGDFGLDYLAWLDAVEKHMPGITYFQCWRDGWGLAANVNTRELMADPRIITRESLAIPGISR
jgi:mannan endo-1,4-beta-mannosidase